MDLLAITALNTVTTVDTIKRSLQNSEGNNAF